MAQATWNVFFKITFQTNTTVVTNPAYLHAGLKLPSPSLSVLLDCKLLESRAISGLFTGDSPHSHPGLAPSRSSLNVCGIRKSPASELFHLRFLGHYRAILLFLPYTYNVLFSYFIFLLACKLLMSRCLHVFFVSLHQASLE